MTPGVEVIHPRSTVAEASEKMKALDVGILPVCDGDRLVGMLTDRDIVVRIIADQRDPKQTRVTEAMTPGVIYSFEDEDVQEAAMLMVDKQIRRLPGIKPRQATRWHRVLGGSCRPDEKYPVER